MTTIVYNASLAKFDLAIESLALRAGYLLADMSISAGRSGIDATLLKNMHSISTHQKILMLENIYKEGEPKEILDTVKEVIRIEKTIKHKTKQQLVALKQTEHVLQTLMNEFISTYTTVFTRAGIMELSQLAEENVFGYYGTSPKPEEPEKEMDYTKASDLLRLTLDEDNVQGNLFFITSEFYNSDFSETRELYKQNGNNENFYLEHCFTLPNLNLLKAPELKAIRNRLREPGTAFRATVNEWMQLCFNNAEMEQRANFFNTKILPSTAALQSAIETNEILRHCGNLLNEKQQMSVLIGELPIALIWDFYKHFDSIHETTWQAIQQLGVPNCRSWPVMILSQPLQTQETSPGAETDQPVSIKKSISID